MNVSVSRPFAQTLTMYRCNFNKVLQALRPYLLLGGICQILEELLTLKPHNRNEFARVRHVSEQFTRDIASCLWLQGTLPALMQGYNGILFAGPRQVRGNDHEHLRRLFLFRSSSAPASRDESLEAQT